MHAADYRVGLLDAFARAVPDPRPRAWSSATASQASPGAARTSTTSRVMVSSQEQETGLIAATGGRSASLAYGQ